MGLYKYGQGYWVRVMTAVLAGLLILSGAAWAMREAGAIEIPVATYSLTLKGVTGDVAPNSTVTVVAEGTNGEEIEVGTGTVLSVTKTPEGAGTMELSKLNFMAGQENAPHKALKSANFAATVASEIPNRIFEPTYLTTGIAALIFLIGAIVIFHFVGRKPGTVDFLIATDGEMRKVNWSTKKEIYGSTMVVVTATFLIAGFLFAVDAGFSSFFRLIGVLHH